MISFGNNKVWGSVVNELTSMVHPNTFHVPIPATLAVTVFGNLSTGISFDLVKTEPSIIYVKLFGESIPRSRRFTVIDSLDNYFSRHGKIRDIGRLKEKYSYLGDFFIVFEKTESAAMCSACHSYTELYPLDPVTCHLPEYQMKVW